MPSEIMDQRRLPSSYAPFMSSSFCSEEIGYPLQKQVGFWRSELPPDNLGLERMPLVSEKSIAPSAVEKFCSVSTSSAQNLKPCQPHQFFKEPKSKPCLEHFMGTDRKAAPPIASWKATDHGLGTRYSTFGQSASLKNKIDLNEFPYENGIFSSSLPGIVNKRFTNGALFNQFTGKVYSNFEVDEPFESLKEIEDKTIGDLLPDDDELFSGVINEVEIEYATPANNSDDVEDDLFYSGGGIELEANGVPKQVDLNGPFDRGYSHGEYPSRTLLVRNINSGVEDADLRFIFEQYGDIHTLHTTFKDHGFIVISYYDLRSACNAIRALQNKLLMQRKLDIQFSVPRDNPPEKDINQGILVVSNLDSSVSNDYLRQVFGLYGEIKEIQGNPHKHQKLIEFYDLRAAEAALHALNRSTIAGKEIQLEPYRGCARGLVQQVTPELEPEEAIVCRKKGNPPNSSPLCYGRTSFRAIISNGHDNGAAQEEQPIRLPVENTFNVISCNDPHYLSSPVKIASAGRHCNQPGDDLSHSMGRLNFGFQHMRSLHPHSLPEYHDGLANSTPNTTTLGLNFLGLAEGVDNRHIPGVSPVGLNSQAFVHNKQAFEASRSGNYLLQGHQYPWNNSPSNQYPLSGPLMWPNSPSRVNSIPTHPPSQRHGLPTAPSNVLNTVRPLHHHHVGSAPTSNPSLWDRRHARKGDFTETSAFLPCSLGNVGFSGSPAMHPLEFGSLDIFPQVGGSCIENPHVRLPSPQRNYHMFHGGRNPMIPIPVAFESPVDRVKSRKSDPSSNQADNKKQYELDIERIIRGEDSRTTLMIKNIPNKYTSKMLLAAIDEHHRGTYDFIYLPIDFKNKCNVGYAFINLIDPQQIIPFYKAFNGKKWEKFNSEKVASLAYARIQGKASLVSHFQNSSLMNEDKRCRPILFHSNGPNAGDQEPFPLGMNIRSRTGRLVTQNNEESHQGSPSNSASVEEFSNGSNSTVGFTDS